MGKFDGYLICTDLDGTFAIGTDVCGENGEYVQYFQENGGLFTAVTGRLPDHIRKFQGFQPNCPIITNNGAVIYDLDAEKPLYKKALPDTYAELITYAFTFHREMLERVWLTSMKGAVNIMENEEADEKEEYFKVVFVADNPEPAKSFRQELDEKFGDRYGIFMAWNVGIECLAKDTNKGTAVKKLKELLGDKVKKVICVGDSESDGFMLRYADIGYAVGNASEETKQAADRVTVHFKDSAIAQIIKDIENEL